MAETYPHMCRDGHVQIGHSDSESEICPLCGALEALRYFAALKDCDEDKDKCQGDSGPYCRTHRDAYLHEEEIAAARAAIAKAEGR